jgi:cytochrome c
MDGWEWTKLGTSVIAAALVALGGAWFAAEVVDVKYPQRRGYAVEGVPPVDLAALQRGWPSGLAQPDDAAELRGYMANIERAVVQAPVAGTAAATPAAPVDLGTLLASADAARGAGTAKLCGACHTFDQGGANRVGPNLWAVVGRDVAATSGFAYSSALSAHPGAWSYEELDRYLASPMRAIPGNKMAFAGIRNPRDRANLLAYLGSLGSAGVPKPAPQPAQTAAPAEGSGGQTAASR